MTVLLVLFTFALFLLIDHLRSRKARAVVADAAPLPARSLVGGFLLPGNLSYHPGHAWALGESPALVRVGMDDFASKLVGRIDFMALPQPGAWVRQGSKLATVTRDGKAVTLLSPVEGTVVEVNENALRDPEGARKDCYGSGWLVAVNAPDKRGCFRNLIGGSLARAWIEISVGTLHCPATAQDGGEALDDFAVAAGLDWEATARRMLLN